MKERITHSLVQGSDEWAQFRFTKFGASEAAAMMGLSRNVTRTELLHAKKTGTAREYSDWVQVHILDHGHTVEAMARPIVEAIIGESLYPVTCSIGNISASCDGLTITDEVAFEHKQWSKSLADAVRAKNLPDEYMPQCQQIMLVTGAEKVVFVVSDGTEENMAYMDVYPDEAWQKRIVDGWKQFEDDLAAYVPPEVVVPPMATPQMGLPALAIQVNGSISLVDNLDKFGDALTAYVRRINKKPESDQDFADLEATVKTLEAAEKALDAAESSALAQTASIDNMRKSVALYRDTARTHRLLVEKLVKAEKENRRNAIVSNATQELSDHIFKLNARIGRHYMPVIASNFPGVVKGLKSLDSMKDKVSTELARCKIEANEIADRIEANLKHELLTGRGFLFADIASLCLKDTSDFHNAVTARITAHEAAEAAKEAATRIRIRAEEQARADKEAAEKLRAATPAPVLTPVEYRPAQVAAEAAKVARIVMAPDMASHDAEPTLKLGEISSRMGFNLTAEFLHGLGFEPAKIDRASKLFHEADFPAICNALIDHIKEVSEQYTPQAA